MPTCMAAACVAATLLFAQWLGALSTLSYTSRSGAVVSLSATVARLRGMVESQPITVTWVRFDPSTGLVETCVATCTAMDSGFEIFTRIRDLAPPEGATRTSVHDTAIGLTYAQLLAKVHADASVAGKTLTTSHGDVVAVEVEDQYPPPARYDHGYRATIFDEYLLRDGVVVAHAIEGTEN